MDDKNKEILDQLLRQMVDEVIEGDESRDALGEEAHEGNESGVAKRVALLEEFQRRACYRNMMCYGVETGIGIHKYRYRMPTLMIKDATPDYVGVGFLESVLLERLCKYEVTSERCACDLVSGWVDFEVEYRIDGYITPSPQTLPTRQDVNEIRSRGHISDLDCASLAWERACEKEMERCKQEEDARAERERLEREAREAQRLKQEWAEREENRAKIIEELERRNIEWFVHFTRVSNLPSILDNGLLTRGDLGSREIRFEESDSQRLERLGNNDGGAICLSVMFPNYLMFYSKRKEDEGIGWCVLLLDAKEVARLDTRYFPTNAASTAGRNKGGDTFQAFAAMFADESEGHRRVDLKIPDYFTTNPQAEVQVYERIPPACIKAIALEDRDWQSLKGELNKQGIRAWSKGWLKDNERRNEWKHRQFFQYRCDCLLWKKGQ